jgi:hypothetical protein
MRIPFESQAPNCRIPKQLVVFDVAEDNTNYMPILTGTTEANSNEGGMF